MCLKVDNMLNIGSIVKIRGSKSLIMVIGYSNIKKELIYDYIGCVYPIGVLYRDECIVFNNSDIKEVVDNGYSNEDVSEFKEDYIKTLSELKNIDKYYANQKKFDETKDSIPEMLQIKRLLPVGSVVKIKNYKNKFMITANLMQHKDNKMFDYMAAIYPEGVYSVKSNYFFNDDDITDIYYFGYSNDKNFVRKAASEYYFKGIKIHME